MCQCDGLCADTCGGSKHLSLGNDKFLPSMDSRKRSHPVRDLSLGLRVDLSLPNPPRPTHAHITDSSSLSSTCPLVPGHPRPPSPPGTCTSAPAAYNPPTWRCKRTGTGRARGSTTVGGRGSRAAGA